MATAVRTMTLAQNSHIFPNNCQLIVSSNVLQSAHYQQQQHHGKRPIAPAIEPRSQNVLTSNGANQVISADKKKYNYGSLPYPGVQTPSVQRRNARERNRVKQVNNGFANLRQHIPQQVVTKMTNGGGRGAAKKLSKVDTLKLAVEYIRSLKDMLDDNENSDLRSTGNSSYYNDMQSIPRSEASLSPTPSYSSDASSSMSYTPNHAPNQQQHFKSEPYDSYAPSTSPAPSFHSEGSSTTHQQQFHHLPPTPTTFKSEMTYQTYPITQIAQISQLYDNENEDDDLLDAIAWWQQQ